MLQLLFTIGSPVYLARLCKHTHAHLHLLRILSIIDGISWTPLIWRDALPTETSITADVPLDSNIFRMPIHAECLDILSMFNDYLLFPAMLPNVHQCLDWWVHRSRDDLFLAFPVGWSHFDLRIRPESTVLDPSVQNFLLEQETDQEYLSSSAEPNDRRRTIEYRRQRNHHCFFRWRSSVFAAIRDLEWSDLRLRCIYSPDDHYRV